MLMPKRSKFRKVQRGSMKGKSKGGNNLNFGSYGIQALESHWITNRQIEAARIAMTRYMKRGGRVWITIFPDKPITKKPAETRMGSGKGNPEEWVAVVKPGRIMFENRWRPARRCSRGHAPCHQQAAHQVQDGVPRKRRRARSRVRQGACQGFRSRSLQGSQGYRCSCRCCRHHRGRRGRRVNEACRDSRAHHRRPQ